MGGLCHGGAGKPDWRPAPGPRRSGRPRRCGSRPPSSRRRDGSRTRPAGAGPRYRRPIVPPGGSAAPGPRPGDPRSGPAALRPVPAAAIARGSSAAPVATAERQHDQDQPRPDPPRQPTSPLAHDSGAPASRPPAIRRRRAAIRLAPPRHLRGNRSEVASSESAAQRSARHRDRLPVELAVILVGLGHFDRLVGRDIAENLVRPAGRPVRPSTAQPSRPGPVQVLLQGVGPPAAPGGDVPRPSASSRECPPARRRSAIGDAPGPSCRRWSPSGAAVGSGADDRRIGDEAHCPQWCPADSRWCPAGPPRAARPVEREYVARATPAAAIRITTVRILVEKP